MAVRHWCFTVNNPTDVDQDFPQSLYTYCVVGKEVGEEGTPHLQGYMVLSKKMRLKALSKFLPRAYLAPAKGTPQEASDYCKKDGDYQEDGELPECPHVAGGKANARRYAVAAMHARQGDLDQVYATDPEIYLRTYANLKRIAKDNPPTVASMDNLTNQWYYGESGIGKSYKARTENPDAYIKEPNKWWDGYQGKLCEFEICNREN